MTEDRWDELGWGPWEDKRLPPRPPTPEESKRLGLPPTLLPVPGTVQLPVFDPALKQHTKAMRAGEPSFPSQEQQTRWYEARRRAVDHVLAAIAASRWGEHLVLRGSVLLRAWYGLPAREPGDLDFVVVPQEWGVYDERSVAMLRGVAQAAEDMSLRDSGDLVTLVADDALYSDIWTYDRVPGRRLVLPWEAGGLPRGTVQLDFVFNEALPAPPALTEVPRADGGEPPLLNAATPELSLAWKLQWLLDDVYPQGKDLYDAWLLAVHTRPSYRMLLDVLVRGEPAHAGSPPTADTLRGLEVDWDEFRKEYPGVQGDADDYKRMLADALEPMFAEADALPDNGYERRALLMAPHVAEYRELRDRSGMDEVWRRLADLRLVDAVVIARELQGRESAGLAETAKQIVTETQRLLPNHWSSGYHRRNPGRVAEAVAELEG
ncbi:nucleotidyl transferase AbiEii/AbiGii toxin family protein [Actinomadura hibisca]|uniref:nucleotidyl transferase AbiEii/AbiGii toxin family protein n=1 Tax=Actinomadura hibisca TaxID=68565 RepID=UPI00082952DB|nr:nucleotidyl transferase AbiEii/AbiGii toxin family protein [Actinomadura hibisca]